MYQYISKLGLQKVVKDIWSDDNMVHICVIFCSLQSTFTTIISLDLIQWDGEGRNYLSIISILQWNNWGL